MLDFLKVCGIEDAVIKDLRNTYSDGNIYTLNSNEFEVIRIINYFREIGIEYINELLIFNLDVFLLKYDEVLEKFNRYNIKEAVEMINANYMSIDKILFD